MASFDIMTYNVVVGLVKLIDYDVIVATVNVQFVL